MGNCGGSKTWRLGLEQVCSLHSEPAPVWSERPVSPCASRSTTEGHLVCINWQTTCFDQMVNDSLWMRKVGLCMCKNVKSNYNQKISQHFYSGFFEWYHSSILAAYDSLDQTQRGQLKFKDENKCGSDDSVHQILDSIQPQQTPIRIIILEWSLLGVIMTDGPAEWACVRPAGPIPNAFQIICKMSHQELVKASWLLFTSFDSSSSFWWACDLSSTRWCSLH